MENICKHILIHLYIYSTKEARRRCKTYLTPTEPSLELTATKESRHLCSSAPVFSKVFESPQYILFSTFPILLLPTEPRAKVTWRPLETAIFSNTVVPTQVWRPTFPNYHLNHQRFWLIWSRLGNNLGMGSFRSPTWFQCTASVKNLYSNSNNTPPIWPPPLPPCNTHTPEEVLSFRPTYPKLPLPSRPHSGERYPWALF